MSPRDARSPRLAGLAVVLGMAAVSPNPAWADPVTLSDLELLLTGGVGASVVLKHVERWGLERDLGAADLLRLKEAGATHDLLEALIGDLQADRHLTRFETMPDGGALLTNLDERGRRLGGEAPQPAPYNRVAPGDARFDPIGESGGAVAPLEIPPKAVPPSGISVDRPYAAARARYGTPGGYTRYKLFYSQAPYDGFRTWVPPVTWLVGAPVIVSTHPGTPYGPVLFSY